jgi:hypothetical protein
MFAPHTYASAASKSIAQVSVECVVLYIKEFLGSESEFLYQQETS